MTPALSRRPAALAAGATVGLAAAYWLPGLASLLPPIRRLLHIRDRMDDPGSVALTFDDGPHPTGTPAILERLAQAHVYATFFLVGEQVERWPALAREIAAAGHTIGVHAYRHHTLPRLGPRRLRADLSRAVAAIHEATGVVPRHARPPRGVFTAGDLLLARQHGWELVFWSRWGRDWEARATPDTIARLAVHDLRGGEIVLLHDADHYAAPGSWRRTAAALPEILRVLSERGLTPAAL